MSTVSDNIRYLRKLKGFTQEQFAERIGIKRSLLGAYEEARANPNEIYLDSMADLLGVQVEHLLNENLRERGRATPPGTILKLNPAMPDAAKAEGQVKVQSDSGSLESLPTGQMDLFAAKAPTRVSPQEAAKAASKAETVSPEPAGLLDTLQDLLNQQTAIRLFDVKDEVPVPGTHILAQKLLPVEKISDNELYVIVTSEKRVLFRRAFNLMHIKGTVILSSDYPGLPVQELNKAEIAEVFQYLGCISTTVPTVALPAQRLRELTAEMAKLLSVQ